MELIPLVPEYIAILVPLEEEALLTISINRVSGSTMGVYVLVDV